MWLKRYFTSERLLALSALAGLALLGYVYAARVTLAYNARCMAQGQTEGNPFLNGLFFFPLLVPIALTIRGTGFLMMIGMAVIPVAVVELILDILPPDIATGCFGMGGDHDDQTKSFDTWALLTALGATLVYGIVILDWLGFAVMSLIGAASKPRHMKNR